MEEASSRLKKTKAACDSKFAVTLVVTLAVTTLLIDNQMIVRACDSVTTNSHF